MAQQHLQMPQVASGVVQEHEDLSIKINVAHQAHAWRNKAIYSTIGVRHVTREVPHGTRGSDMVQEHHSWPIPL